MRIIFILGHPGSGQIAQTNKLSDYLEQNNSKVVKIISSDSEEIKSNESAMPNWILENLNNKIDHGKFTPFLFDGFCVVDKLRRLENPPDFIIWCGAPKSYNELIILKDFIYLFKVKAQIIFLTITENVSRTRLTERGFTELEIGKKLSYFKKTTLPSLEAMKDKDKDFYKDFEILYINDENIEPSVFNNILRKLNL